MDLPDAPSQAAASPKAPSRRVESRRTAHRRDRLLSALNLSMAAALLLALPFALQAGSVFFLPLAAGLTFGMVLAPMQVRLERLLPPPIAAIFVLALVFLIIFMISYVIVMPALLWLNELPVRLPIVRSNLAPILDMFDTVDQTADRLTEGLGMTDGAAPPPPGDGIGAPSSVVDAITSAAPSALLQSFFALLIITFFLASYTRIREVLVASASTVSGAKKAERLLADVAQDTGRYVGMITVINVILGLVVTGVFWLLGIEDPYMWGGLAGLLNFVPYVGPVVFFLLAVVGGMAIAPDPLTGLVPAISYLAVNLMEAYVLTPLMLGRRFLINPLLIMIALSFWGWVWGVMGAVLSVPLLIITRSLLRRVGGPNFMGFLLDQTTLMRENFVLAGNRPGAPRPVPPPPPKESAETPPPAA